MTTLWKSSSRRTLFQWTKFLHQRSPTPMAGMKPARVEGLPLLPLKFDVRLVGHLIPVHQLNIGPRRSTMTIMRAQHEFTNLPAVTLHRKTLAVLGHSFTKEKPTAVYQRLHGKSTDGTWTISYRNATTLKTSHTRCRIT